MVLDPKGIPMGNSFSFGHTYNGFYFKLWQKLKALPFVLQRLSLCGKVTLKQIHYFQLMPV